MIDPLKSYFVPAYFLSGQGRIKRKMADSSVEVVAQQPPENQGINITVTLNLPLFILSTVHDAIKMAAVREAWICALELMRRVDSGRCRRVSRL